ncbi:MAG: hypothetical protein ACE5FP_02395 [Gemmatimonadota bacterium]
MRPPEDEVLLRDMLDHARRAVAAVAEKERSSLDSDFILAAQGWFQTDGLVGTAS